jgi:hypothetical protein
MKKPLLIVIIILVVLLALPVINLLRWTFQTKKPMDIIIVDKTVSTFERVKHKSLNWILTNDRFVKKENRSSYSYKKDYYGFMPTRPKKARLYDQNNLRLNNLIVLADSIEAVYFTDTYGVFFNDWYQGINKSRRSRKLYGGLNNNDNSFIKEMKDRHKLVILEYNTFDYPTPEYESYRIQERLGIKYSGWTGKYYTSLDTITEDFPIWMTAMYRKQYKKPWTFKKSGVVLIKDKAIIVLEEGTHVGTLPVQVVTDSAYCKKYILPETIAFGEWFDIIDPLQNIVISTFKIGTTSLGDSLLADYGLENTFPAVIQDPEFQRTYYFSGDFTSTDVPVWTSKFKGVDKMKGIIYTKKPDDFRKFFWLYYKPLITGIFDDYYKSLSAK